VAGHPPGGCLATCLVYHVCERFNDIVVGSLYTLKSDIDTGNSITEPTARARCVLCAYVVVSASVCTVCINTVQYMRAFFRLCVQLEGELTT